MFFYSGIDVTEADLKNVALLSGILNTEGYFIMDTLREKCSTIVPHPEDLKPEEYVEAYLRLKYSIIVEE